MNQLANETSPYLLQHAQNPVHWQAWRPETLEKARLEQQPILVSIGYSTCHWCHVMERESFENEATAELMNRLFLCIKIDREERPDLDQIYMEACQIMTGSGGWPLNVFLLPDGRPFFAGTYYPPRPAHNRPSWRQVLEHLGMIWAEKREVAVEQAAKLTASIERNDLVFLKKTQADSSFIIHHSSLFNPVLLDATFWQMSQNFDRDAGGFGSAPKFPSSMAIDFLMRYGHVFSKTEALEHAFFSLEKMARGGIYDLLGGGFSRYSTDADWLVPHFEKMLYDNALLLAAFSDALKLLQKQPFSPENEARKTLFSRTIRETGDWLFREMTDSDGSFFSAQDADSEGEEGKFFVWQLGELFEILGEKEGQLFADFHGAVGGEGNWEHGQNILHRPFDTALFCQKEAIDAAVFEEKMARARSVLFEKRGKRIWPGRDEKRILGWNALMISGLAKAFEATGDARFRAAAAKNLDFIFEKMRRADGSFFHVFTAKKAEIEAFLEDLACLAAACVDFYEISFDEKWLSRAAEIVEKTNSDFWDSETSTFFFASKNQTDLVIRRRDLYDNATPSGNSTMASVLQRLGLHFGRDDWREQAQKMLAVMRETVERFPLSFERWASAMLFETVGAREIAVVGRGFEEKAFEISQLFLPARVLAASEMEAEKWPLLASKNGAAGDDALIFLCENQACRAPVSTVAELLESF